VSLVSSFLSLLQPLAAVFTAPSFESLLLLLPGWVFAKRRTVTQMLLASGALAHKHHSSFHRLFAQARWNLDELGLALFDLLRPWMGRLVTLSFDDTLAHKRGKKVFGAGMHHDSARSSRRFKVISYGHNWVFLCVVLRFPFAPHRVFSLPLLFRLYLNKKSAKRWDRVYRSRSELAVQLLDTLCSRFPKQAFHAVADSAYGGEPVLAHLPSNCDLTSSCAMTTRLYGPVPPRRKGQIGRPRLRGDLLGKPAQLISRRARVLSHRLYGRKDRCRAVSLVAYFHKVPSRAVKVVVVEPLVGGRMKRAFFSTRVSDSAEEVLRRYARRWSVEEAIQAAKSHLGFEEPQGWTRQAVKRTAPMAMMLYSLIVAWFAKVGHLSYRLVKRPWYQGKRYPSFEDMLAMLKRESLREQISAWALPHHLRGNLLEALCVAASAPS